ncbi:MAG TPA: iron ABC transporter substrate-binding protein [Micromonosporaceae bacterium]|nr:iron ABC transporter substrate-binding protein [Micromonosporaceae bacterium]
MFPARRRAIVALAAASLAALGLTACGAEDGGEAGVPNDKKIIVYSGRSESLVKPLLEKFSQQSGVTVETRYGTTAQMAAQLLEEGKKSPADVFFAQDAGALGAVSKEGLFATLPAEALNKVPAKYRADNGHWVGLSARARVLAYNPDQVPAARLPKSVFDLTRPEWKGKIGIAPTNGSFQAFVTAMRVQHGDARTKEFLAGLKANEPQVRDGNVKILEDVNAGTIAVGLINHYYLGEVAKEQGATPEQLKAKLYFFPNRDTGALVNVAGVGVLSRSAEDKDVETFLDYMLGTEAQQYFATETFEYPVVAGVPGPAYVPPLAKLNVPPVNLNDLDTLNETITLIKESGLVP